MTDTPPPAADPAYVAQIALAAADELQARAKQTKGNKLTPLWSLLIRSSDALRKCATLIEQLQATVARLTERQFPIMGGPSIPWSVIGPCNKQAVRNHGQTLERLAERGGLCPSEAVDVLTGQRWRTTPNEGALERLLTIVRERQANPRAEAAEAKADETKTFYANALAECERDRRAAEAQVAACHSALRDLGFPQYGRDVHPGRPLKELGWVSPEALAQANKVAADTTAAAARHDAEVAERARREALELLQAFRDHVSENAVQWKDGGGSHHHPIWAQVADAVAKLKEESQHCKVCAAPISSAELCERCAAGNDPFLTSKYGERRQP